MVKKKMDDKFLLTIISIVACVSVVGIVAIFLGSGQSYSRYNYEYSDLIGQAGGFGYTYEENIPTSSSSNGVIYSSNFTSIASFMDKVAISGSSYVIVIPQNASSELIRAVSEFAARYGITTTYLEYEDLTYYWNTLIRISNNNYYGDDRIVPDNYAIIELVDRHWSPNHNDFGLNIQGSSEKDIIIALNKLRNYNSYSQFMSERVLSSATDLIVLYCYDSDGGLNYYEKGFVNASYYVSGFDSPAHDMCIDSITLREMFCNTLGLGEPKLYDCPYGCYDGACVDENSLSILFIPQGLPVYDENSSYKIRVYIDGEEREIIHNKLSFTVLNVSYGPALISIFHPGYEPLENQMFYVSPNLSNNVFYYTMDEYSWCYEIDNGVYTLTGDYVNYYYDGCDTHPFLPALIKYHCRPFSYNSDFAIRSYRDIRCPNGCVDGACVVFETPISEVLYQAALAPDTFDVVIGRDAATSDNVVAVDISGFTRIESVVFDTDVYNLTKNMIVIGGPCVNQLSSYLLDVPMNRPDCVDRFPVNPGEGLIQVFQNNGYYQIVVAGYTADDTRRAGRYLIENMDRLNTTSIII
ncbi:MAG: hypothetical protein ACMXYG_01340 [Candidatus Woesearchaeota archaeon]